MNIYSMAKTHIHYLLLVSFVVIIIIVAVDTAAFVHPKHSFRAGGGGSNGIILILPPAFFSASTLRRRIVRRYNHHHHHSMMMSLSSDAQQRIVYGKDDALFGYIEKQQQSAVVPDTTGSSTRFGHVLDAGTGLHSLRWLASLHHTQQLSSVTAITADRQMQRTCQAEIQELEMTNVTTVLYGKWFPAEEENENVEPEATIVQQLQQLSPPHQEQQQQQKFNVIIADYLIGAMDGFRPYQQDLMIPQLLDLLAPHGRLYIVGLEPIPDPVPHNNSDPNHNNVEAAQQLIGRVRQTRDACILLAGHRCYREYPLTWILRQVTNQPSPGVRLVHSKQFPILYRHATIMKQINVGRSKIPHLPVSLRESMQQLWNALEQESQRITNDIPNGRVQFGFDYVVAIEKI